MSKEYAKECFLSNTKDHKLTVLLDRGIYKHLRFMNPESSTYWFDITTWPNYLCICGDVGDYVFSRIEDMFSFFRNTKLQIEPYYWDQKIKAGDSYTRGSLTQEWSQELFRKRIREHVNCYAHNLSTHKVKQVWEQVQNEILCCNDKLESIIAVRDFDNKYINFVDFSWNCEEYSFPYLWCCYAIVHAINKYDELKSND